MPIWPTTNWSSSSRAPGRRGPRSRRRLGIEPLETRALLSGGGANLRLTNAYLSDSAGVPISQPEEHVPYWLTAEWETTDLPAEAEYRVRFELADKTRESSLLSWGAGEASRSFLTVRGPFQMLTAGDYTARVRVDPGNLVSETNESDNELLVAITAAPAPPPPVKFRLPIGGVPNVDWSILNYVDLDPGEGFTDYRGGNYTYHTHDAIDFMLPNFAAMDRGVPVYAAADGVVNRVVDGQFDRNTSCQGPGENFVLLDHGDGWQTNYAHFRMNTIAVSPGQSVAAGDFLGYVGSSGCSTDAHLHFVVWHHEVPVETYLDPDRYWLPGETVPYAGDTPGVLDFGLTDAPVTTALLKERPPDRYVFAPASGQTPRFWARVHGLPPGTELTVRWYQPNGALFGAPQTTVLTQELRYDPFTAVRGLSPASPQGAWQVALDINGAEVARDTFWVSSVPAPEVRLNQGSTYVLDGRTTPLDLGTAAQGSASPTLTLSVVNHGTGPLELGALTVPARFFVVTPPPVSVAAGGSATFTLGLLTETPGKFSGQVQLATNDASEASYDFAVSGRVTDVAPRVTGLWVSGGAWSSGGPAGGGLWTAVPVGSGEQLRPLPWAGIDRVRLAFSEPALVAAGDLTVSGSEGTLPLAPGGFAYDAAAHTATWTLAVPVAADAIELRLASGLGPGVRDLTQQQLDGEWANPVSPAAPTGDLFPSGNGQVGGDFVFRLQVLVGDVNGDGQVGSGDYVLWAAQAGQVPGDPRADLDASGTVGSGDYTIWAARFGGQLGGHSGAVRAPASLNLVVNGGALDDTARLSAAAPERSPPRLAGLPHDAAPVNSLWEFVRRRIRLRSGR